MALSEQITLVEPVVAASRSIHRIVIDIDNHYLEVDWKYYDAEGNFCNKTKEVVIDGENFINLCGEKTNIDETISDAIKRIGYQYGK